MSFNNEKGCRTEVLVFLLMSSTPEGDPKPSNISGNCRKNCGETKVQVYRGSCVLPEVKISYHTYLISQLKNTFDAFHDIRKISQLDRFIHPEKS
jgi:hypothetical protein